MTKRAPSLQWRLALGIGLLMSLMWIAAAAATATLLRHEVDEVFDASLAATAQRILPLAAMEIMGREDEHAEERVATLNRNNEHLSYVVRDRHGRVLFRSHDADLSNFPAFNRIGFHQEGNIRFFDDSIMSGALTVTVAEPLDHRQGIYRSMMLMLGLPLLVVVPLSLFGIGVIVRRSLTPLRRLRDGLAQRGANDLSPVATVEDMPAETAPVVDALNDLLARLTKTFEAERSFAANAAHELRTPLAGAIAQVQRLKAETEDPAARKRGSDIERTLKRLTLLSERLMQLARAEGSRLRIEKPADVRPVLRLVIDDLRRLHPDAAIALQLPDTPILSDIDPDAFGILCRNLVDNALKHGAENGDIEITLSADRKLTAVNECAPVPADVLARLTERFERNEGAGEGSGLGLAIVRTIGERSGGHFDLASPAPGRNSGFAATFTLPEPATMQNKS